MAEMKAAWALGLGAPRRSFKPHGISPRAVLDDAMCSDSDSDSDSDSKQDKLARAHLRAHLHWQPARLAFLAYTEERWSAAFNLDWWKHTDLVPLKQLVDKMCMASELTYNSTPELRRAQMPSGPGERTKEALGAQQGIAGADVGRAQEAVHAWVDKHLGVRALGAMQAVQQAFQVRMHAAELQATGHMH